MRVKEKYQNAEMSDAHAELLLFCSRKQMLFNILNAMAAPETAFALKTDKKTIPLVAYQKSRLVQKIDRPSVDVCLPVCLRKTKLCQC